ncbi:hypothetical protein ABZW02_09740 [Streptomyces sp. NPDC005180]|uniref:hypothetical protein n=1 Tax=Streptomyces sp. NPDC005180 TaxID=3156868 RepID=UPI0033BE9A87
MRKPLTATAVAVMAAIGLAAPAQATVNSVDRPFSMAYGNSTTSGTIHFTDGYSASLSGAVHAASGSRMVCAWGENGTVTTGNTICSPWANAGGPDRSFSGSLQIELPGGVQRVYIAMYDENGTPRAEQVCSRTSCTRLY